MTLFSLEILTPEGPVYEGDVKEVTALTVAGKIGVMARHTPLLSVLKPGILSIKLDEKKVETTKFQISGGIIEVRRSGKVVVLADTAEPAN